MSFLWVRIIITFLLNSNFDLEIFFPLFVPFTILGLLEDYVSRDKVKIKIPKRIPFYSIIGVTYSIITGFWIIFFIFLFYESSYILTDKFGLKFLKK